MKYIIIIILIAASYACKSRIKDKPDKKIIDSTEIVVEQEPSEIGPADSRDSLFIIPEPGDTLRYLRAEFFAIKKAILGEYGPDHPDIFFAKNEVVSYKDSAGNSNKVYFSCEVCRDGLFETYAYVLRSKNGISKYAADRNRLIEAFRIINEIYGNLSGGGTYFGHQLKRILAYAEYAIYLKADNGEYYDKKYSINNQKQIFIHLLTQKLNDEIDDNNNNGLTPNDKASLKKRLFKKVADLNELILDEFSLKSIQEFDYSHY
jgi:hypothetical protein